MIETLNEIVAEIRKFYSTENSDLKCRIVDVESRADLQKLIAALSALDVEMFDASSLAKFDYSVSVDSCIKAISQKNKPLIVKSVSELLFLKGTNEVSDSISKIFSTTEIHKQCLFILFGCQSVLKDFSNPQCRRRIYIVNSVSDRNEALPTLKFIPKEYEFYADAQSSGRYAVGVNNIPSLIQDPAIEDIYVVTERNFDKATYAIDKLTSPYALISSCNKEEFSAIDESIGDNDKWTELLKEISNSSFKKYITEKFGETEELENEFGKYNLWDDFSKWVYVLALKAYRSDSNSYLADCARSFDGGRTLPELIVYKIAESYTIKFDNFTSQNEYWPVYKQRYVLLNQIKSGNLKFLMNSFCKNLDYKRENALFYLTDITKTERDNVFEILDKYCKDISRYNLKSCFEKTYPALGEYLGEFSHFVNSDSDYLKDYFSSYTECVVKNKLTEEHRRLLEKAYPQLFEQNIPKRSRILGQKEKSNMFFIGVDALGLEFVPYIKTRCKEYGLTVIEQVGLCELPSITSLNKPQLLEFIDPEEKNGKWFRNLDEIKHKRNENYEYHSTKLPIHISDELEFIDKVISFAASKLNDTDIERVIISSDHGATRLAVTSNDAKINVQSQGEHSGRCCRSENITLDRTDNFKEENGFYCLTDYKRFTGSRLADVECHGGACPEEILVPILTIEKKQTTININVCDDYKVIKSKDWNKSRTIQIYSDRELQHCRIVLKSDNREFFGEKISENIYKITMPTVRKAGTYEFNVFDGDEPVGGSLTFRIKGNENNIGI